MAACTGLTLPREGCVDCEDFECGLITDKLAGFESLGSPGSAYFAQEVRVAKKTTSLSGLGGLVFSTDAGRHCPQCSQPLEACVCKQSVLPEGDGIARVRRESKGRGGKTVTTITGVPLAEAELKELASALKRRCGTGGALKEGVIEIQGDHVQLLIDELVKRGFKAKKSGG